MRRRVERSIRRRINPMIRAAHLFGLGFLAIFAGLLMVAAPEHALAQAVRTISNVASLEWGAPTARQRITSNRVDTPLASAAGHHVGAVCAAGEPAHRGDARRELRRLRRAPRDPRARSPTPRSPASLRASRSSSRSIAPPPIATRRSPRRSTFMSAPTAATRNISRSSKPAPTAAASSPSSARPPAGAFADR